MRLSKLAYVGSGLLLGCALAWAQSNYITPGGQYIPGVQLLCQNGSAQSVPCSLSAPLSVIGAELPTDASGTFTNATQTTAITATGLDGYGTSLVTINGTYGTASGVFELSDDAGTTWYSVQASRINGCTVETGYSSLTNTNQAWIIPISGADQFRVRSTAVASGTVTVRISTSSAIPPNAAAVCGSVSLSSQLPSAGTAGKTTYLCGFSITSAAVVALAGTATVTGPIGGTMSYIQPVGLLTSAGHLPQTFSPCIPASATNTGFVITSVAAGTGGLTAVNAWGYQQ